MALDAETQGFLGLKDVEIGPWTAARAAERDLVIPSAILPGVIDNIALLRTQTSLFVSALEEAAGEAPEAFEP
ncbi:hypothetical protein [Caulobacter sp.]|uniref:hypothetical protein n=1 Tax=Caulobacter sp. TaxID=78 RepID=UPI001B178058|nr:hypothetical protein [Caulobacter sp.]MBO9546660.1 hypothetical protein [Caulobacter sp.]